MSKIVGTPIIVLGMIIGAIGAIIKNEQIMGLGFFVAFIGTIIALF